MRPIHLLMSFFLPVLLFSCNKTEKPLTQEQISAFKNALVRSIERKDPRFLNEAIDVNTFISRMKFTGGSSRSEMKNAIAKHFKFGDNTMKTIGEKPSMSLVRQYEKDKKQHVLMRLYDGSLNYLDIELVRVKDQGKIADIYIYTSGENLSKTVSELFGEVYQAIDKGTMGKDDAWIENVEKMRNELNAGNYREAKVLFDQLPPDLQKNKAVQITNIQICSNLDESEYDNALQQYERNFPNERNTHLLMIDGYVIRKQYDKMLHAVNMLDSMLGGDPFLDFYRSIAYANLNDDAMGKLCLERMVKKLPDFEDGVLELMVYYLDDKEYDKAKKLENEYKANRDFDQSRLTTILSVYPDYH